VNGSGNAWIAGRFSEAGDFDPGTGVTELVCDPLQYWRDSVFVVQLADSGVLEWARPLCATEGTGPPDIAVDGSGNTWLTGSFGGEIDTDPGPGTLRLRTDWWDENGFAATLSESGDLGWAWEFGFGSDLEGPSHNDSCDAVAVDPSGRGYVVCSFCDEASYWTNTVTSDGCDVFVAQLMGP
jgi:hypothetical protein